MDCIDHIHLRRPLASEDSLLAQLRIPESSFQDEFLIKEVSPLLFPSHVDAGLASVGGGCQAGEGGGGGGVRVITTAMRRRESAGKGCLVVWRGSSEMHGAERRELWR